MPGQKGQNSCQERAAASVCQCVTSSLTFLKLVPFLQSEYQQNWAEWLNTVVDGLAASMRDLFFYLFVVFYSRSWLSNLPMKQPNHNWREKVKQLWETTSSEHETLRRMKQMEDRWRQKARESDREKKERKGRTKDESISKLLWSVTESRTGRWMPVGVLSEQRSTFCCIHPYTSSALIHPPTARKHVWNAQWVLQGTEHVWGQTPLIYVAPAPKKKGQQTPQLSPTRHVK